MTTRERRNIPFGRRSKLPRLEVTVQQAISRIREVGGRADWSDQEVLRACLGWAYEHGAPLPQPEAKPKAEVKPKVAAKPKAEVTPKAEAGKEKK